jgi:glutathione S-transferase
MKLYYTPMTCSLATNIACREAGLGVEMLRVELQSKRIEGGGELTAVNAMGQVPTIVMDDGRMLTENAAVLTYVADCAADKGLAPPAGSFERYELTRWLGFVGTEIHKKGMALIFDPTTPEAVKSFARAAIAKPLGVAEAHLAGREFLLGAMFTVADAYLFWALTIAPFGGVPLDAYPSLRAYQKRIYARPAVRAAVDQERVERERDFAA